MRKEFLFVDLVSWTLNNDGKTLTCRLISYKEVHISYNKGSNLLILVHHEKHHLEFIQSVIGTHISRAIVFRVLVEKFLVVPLVLFSYMIVWYVSEGNKF